MDGDAFLKDLFRPEDSEPRSANQSTSAVEVVKQSPFPSTASLGSPPSIAPQSTVKRPPPAPPPPPPSGVALVSPPLPAPPREPAAPQQSEGVSVVPPVPNCLPKPPPQPSETMPIPPATTPPPPPPQESKPPPAPPAAAMRKEGVPVPPPLPKAIELPKPSPQSNATPPAPSGLPPSSEESQVGSAVGGLSLAPPHQTLQTIAASPPSKEKCEKSQPVPPVPPPHKQVTLLAPPPPPAGPPPKSSQKLMPLKALEAATASRIEKGGLDPLLASSSPVPSSVDDGDTCKNEGDAIPTTSVGSPYTVADCSTSSQPKLAVPALPIPLRQKNTPSSLTSPELVQKSPRGALKSPEGNDSGSGRNNKKSVRWNGAESETASFLEIMARPAEEKLKTGVPTENTDLLVSNCVDQAMKYQEDEMHGQEDQTSAHQMVQMEQKPEHVPPPQVETVVAAPLASITAVAKQQFVQDIRGILDDQGMGLSLYSRLSSGSTGTVNPTPWVLRSILQRAGGIGVVIDAGKLAKAWPSEKRAELCSGESDFCERWLPIIVESVLAALDESASAPLLAPEIPSWLEDWAVSAAVQDCPPIRQNVAINQTQDDIDIARISKPKVFHETVTSMQALVQDPMALLETGEALCRQYRFRSMSASDVLGRNGLGSSSVDAKHKDVSNAVVPATLLQLWHHVHRLGMSLDGTKMEVHWTKELWLSSHPNDESRESLSSNEFSIHLLPRIVNSIISSVVECDRKSDNWSKCPPQWLEAWASQTAAAFRSHQMSDAVEDHTQTNQRRPPRRSEDQQNRSSSSYPTTLDLPPFQTLGHTSYPQASLSITQLPAMMAELPIGKYADSAGHLSLPIQQERNTRPNELASSQLVDLQLPPVKEDLNLGAVATALGGPQASEAMQALRNFQDRKRDLDKTLGLMQTWSPRTATDLSSFKETGDCMKANAKELSEGLNELRVTLDMTLGMSEAENVFRTKATEAIGDMLDELEHTRGKLAVIAKRKNPVFKDSAPLVIGVIGIEEHLAPEFVLEEARRLLAQGLNLSSEAAKFLLECTRQLFVRRFNTSLMMWRMMTPGGKSSVGMRDIAHAIYRADKVALPREVLRAIWVEALQESVPADGDGMSIGMQKRSRKMLDARCAYGCVVCGITLKARLEGMELERLDFPGFSRAFIPSTANENTRENNRGRKSVGDIAGNTTGPANTSWLRSSSSETRSAVEKSAAPQSRTCDLLAHLLNEAQGMDAQTFRRAVWAGLARECASRINSARKNRMHVLQHMYETDRDIARGNLHDSNCTLAELLHEWHEIQALRGAFGTIVEYPFKKNLADDFTTVEKESRRKVEIEDENCNGCLDYAEEPFLQTVVTNVTLGGLTHQAGVRVGSRVVSVGLQSATYNVLEGHWGAGGKGGRQRMVHVVAFVGPEHREGGEAMQELLASSRPGNCFEDFAKVIHRLCRKPDGKCRYSIRQINAMWESISAHGNHDNLRVTRFMARRALRYIKMPMDHALEHIFKAVQENERQSAKKDLDRRLSSAFRCLQCVTETRRSDTASNVALQFAKGEPFQKRSSLEATTPRKTIDLSECPRCSICHAWGHTSAAPHLVFESHARCRRRLDGAWAATSETPETWSGLCDGYGHHDFQCPGRYASAPEGTMCKLCLGEHTGSQQLLGAHPHFESFLARHGTCKACGGIGHWWRACPHGKVDTVNLHEFVRTRAIYLSDVLREIGKL